MRTAAKGRAQGEPLIRLEEVTRVFAIEDRPDGRLYVLRGVTMAVERGEIVAVVGASGAGKSTLLHIMGTLDRPTAGRVFYDGADVFSLDDDEVARFRNRTIGFVFQFHHLLGEFTALENVMMPALIGGRKPAEVEPEARALLGEVGMADRSGEKPTKLSGGEQQRVAVARALINTPRVVLADEPSGNLDAANAQGLHELIWTLSRSRGITFVVVTHNEPLARKADRVVKIADGVVRTPGGRS
ncbi:MAG: ABC transporter ATP-binding protein [Bacteroidota bacterium]